MFDIFMVASDETGAIEVVPGDQQDVRLCKKNL